MQNHYVRCQSRERCMGKYGRVAKQKTIESMGRNTGRKGYVKFPVIFGWRESHWCATRVARNPWTVLATSLRTGETWSCLFAARRTLADKIYNFAWTKCPNIIRPVPPHLRRHSRTPCINSPLLHQFRLISQVFGSRIPNHDARSAKFPKIRYMT